MTAQLLRQAPCPVWASLHLERAAPPIFRRILCALALSDPQEKTLAWALQFAASCKAICDIVHVSRDGLTPACRDELNHIREKLDGNSHLILAGGDMRDAVCEACRDLSSDLLVIGRSAVDNEASPSSGRDRLPLAPKNKMQMFCPFSVPRHAWLLVSRSNSCSCRTRSKFGLKLERDVDNLVQKERALIRQFKTPHFLGDRSVKCSFFVAEQFTLQKPEGKSRRNSISRRRVAGASSDRVSRGLLVPCRFRSRPGPERSNR